MINVRKKITLICTLCLLIILVLIGVFVKVEVELLLPGGITDVSKTIEVQSDNEISGTYNTTYVSVITRPNLITYLTLRLGKHNDVYELSEQYSHLTNEEIHQSGFVSKESSIDISTIVAFEAADLTLNYEESGLWISYIEENASIDGKLEIGDKIIGINDIDVKNYETFKNLNDDFDCGENLQIKLVRDDETIKVDVNKQKVNDSCKFGFVLTQDFDINNVNPTINFSESSSVGGSGGLLQTLSIYDYLTSFDHTKGMTIAGTGTISIDGEVGSIGGVKQKVIGAHEDGVDIFFVPDVLIDGQNTNYEDALSAAKIIKTDMKIVPIKTFDAAVDYLTNYQIGA